MKGLVNTMEKMTNVKAINYVLATAEILYRFLSGDENFIESHTGLEDCEIEKEILVYCLKKHPQRKKLWEN